MIPEEYPDNCTGNELLRMLPPVLRAREYHLYLEGGRRLTDLWQFGGKAVLGHKPPRAVSELKNAAERGLFSPLPHPAEQRLLKALARLFPDLPEGPRYCFRIYEDRFSLYKALEKAGFSSKKIPDPAFPLIIKNENVPKLPISVWRPFLDENYYLSSIYIPVLPWPLTPAALFLEKSLEKDFPPDDLISPVILLTCARAIHDLIAAGKNSGRPRYPKIEKTLFRAKNWRRRGIYLTRIPENDNRAELWKHFLDNGFLIPPVPSEPLILPGVLSPGEEAKLASILAEYD